MKKLTLYTLLSIASSLAFNVSNAQTTLAAAGGEAKGAGGRAYVTIGQVFYTTTVGTGVTIRNGIQHPYSISALNKYRSSDELMPIDSTHSSSLNYSVYPNPTTDLLNLTVEGSLVGLRYQLYDAEGKLLNSATISDYTSQVSLSQLAAATYYLSVSNEKNEIKTFKIIKYN